MKIRHIKVSGFYEWVQFDGDPNKNPDLVDLSVCYLISDEAWFN